MSRRRRSRGSGVKNMSGFDGANQSMSRGWIYWPSLDTSKEVSSYDRNELLKKARWLYANVGLARRVVNGLSTMIGYLTPQAQTDDAEWNRMAEDYFNNTAGYAPVFDRAGKVNFYEWQFMLNRMDLKDGDILTVLSKNESKTAQVVIYESHQITDGTYNINKPANLRDGVFVDQFGRHLAYRVSDNAQELGKERFATVPASSAIFYADFERHGQVRGITSLAHAITNLQDRTEINRDVKHGIKVGNQLGYYVTSKVPPTTNNPLGLSLNSPPRLDGNGNPINIAAVQGGGMTPVLGDGQDLKTLHDSRPHQNQQAFLEELMRDIAHGTGVPYEILCRISGLTGPATRYVMSELERWISVRHDRLEVVCKRYWVYAIANAINNGKLRLPKGRANWWKCSWLPQASLTIDKGREGMLQLQQLAAGATTLAEIYKSQGLGDWRDNADQRLTEIAYIKQKAEAMGIPLQLVLGTNSMQPIPATQEDEDLTTPSE